MCKHLWLIASAHRRVDASFQLEVGSNRSCADKARKSETETRAAAAAAAKKSKLALKSSSSSSSSSSASSGLSAMDDDSSLHLGNTAEGDNEHVRTLTLGEVTASGAATAASASAAASFSAMASQVRSLAAGSDQMRAVIASV